MSASAVVTTAAAIAAAIPPTDSADEGFVPGFVAAPVTDAAVDPLVFRLIGELPALAEDFSLPAAALLAPLGRAGECWQIGTLAGRPCLLELWPALPLEQWPAGLRKGDFRQLWTQWPPALLAALNRARQLAHWRWQHRFCSACATPLETLPTEPGRRCPACASVYYPRLAPVCIGLVRRGDELLRARNRKSVV